MIAPGERKRSLVSAGVYGTLPPGAGKPCTVAMSSVNLFTREISIKIVYYGPGLGGKTSSLQYVHRALKSDSRGQLVSLATGSDRTLYFDFLPVKLPKLRGYAIRVQLYTVPGQVHYNSTRKLVLAGADGIVFVADSQADRANANVESLENLRENLAEQGLRLDQVPYILQYNKRDVPDVLPVGDLNAALNGGKVPAFETIATSGRGIFEGLKSITTLVLSDLRRRGLWDGGQSGAKPAAPKEFDKDGESIANKLQALSEAEAAVSRMEPAAPPSITHPSSQKTEISGAFPIPSQLMRGARGPQLSELLPQGSPRDAVMAVEAELDRGDYAQAIRLAARGFTEAAERSVTSGGDSGPVLHALMLGMPGERWLRFREVTRRADSGAASSADALFALFFLVDSVLRK
jgi:signal recognition particle receptor subunit beta